MPARRGDQPGRRPHPLCGDKLDVYLTVEDGVVRDVSFEGAGCAISTASASLTTEAVKGKPVAEVERLFESFHALVTGKAEPGTADLGSAGFQPAGTPDVVGAIGLGAGADNLEGIGIVPRRRGELSTPWLLQSPPHPSPAGKPWRKQSKAAIWSAASSTRWWTRRLGGRGLPPMGQSTTEEP